MKPQVLKAARGHVHKQQQSSWAAPIASPACCSTAEVQHKCLLHSHTWDVGVAEAARDSPLIDLQLQCIDFVYVTRYPAKDIAKVL